MTNTNHAICIRFTGPLTVSLELRLGPSESDWLVQTVHTAAWRTAHDTPDAYKALLRAHFHAAATAFAALIHMALGTVTSAGATVHGEGAGSYDAGARLWREVLQILAEADDETPPPQQDDGGGVSRDPEPTTGAAP